MSSRYRCLQACKYVGWQQHTAATWTESWQASPHLQVSPDAPTGRRRSHWAVLSSPRTAPPSQLPPDMTPPWPTALPPDLHLPPFAQHYPRTTSAPPMPPPPAHTCPGPPLHSESTPAVRGPAEPLSLGPAAARDPAGQAPGIEGQQGEQQVSRQRLNRRTTAPHNGGSGSRGCCRPPMRNTRRQGQGTAPARQCWLAHLVADGTAVRVPQPAAEHLDGCGPAGSRTAAAASHVSTSTSTSTSSCAIAATARLGRTQAGLRCPSALPHAAPDRRRCPRSSIFCGTGSGRSSTSTSTRPVRGQWGCDGCGSYRRGRQWGSCS